MSYLTKQRTRIEDLSCDGNELIDLSQEQMLMVGGGLTVLCQIQTETPLYDFITGQCTYKIETDEYVDDIGGGYEDDNSLLA